MLNFCNRLAYDYIRNYIYLCNHIENIKESYCFLLCFLYYFQMLGCKTRGFSFTRALLGIAADELHLCGDPAAVPLIQEILKVTGDHVEVTEMLLVNIWAVFSYYSL